MKIDGHRSVAALEYERIAKSKSRYVRKIQDYYDYEDIKAVFYICDNKTIEKSILEIDRKVGDNDKPKFFVCLAKDVQKGSSKLTFRNFKDQKITIS